MTDSQVYLRLFAVRISVLLLFPLFTTFAAIQVIMFKWDVFPVGKHKFSDSYSSYMVETLYRWHGRQHKATLTYLKHPEKIFLWAAFEKVFTQSQFVYFVVNGAMQHHSHQNFWYTWPCPLSRTHYWPPPVAGQPQSFMSNYLIYSVRMSFNCLKVIHALFYYIISLNIIISSASDSKHTCSTCWTLGTLRYGDYGLRPTVGCAFFFGWNAGPSTLRVARKCEVKKADYRQQTTNEERRSTLH